MESSYGLDVRRIVNIFYLQKAFIITVSAVVLALAGYLTLSLPDIYESRTLISVSPQKLPPNYVNSTVTSSVEQRIRSISDEILSRKRLETIVREFNLYPTSTSMDARVDRLRKNVRIDVRRNSVPVVESFALSFLDKDPQKAQQVASRLGGFFIAENTEIRERQVAGTRTFINDESDRLRKQLEEQEQQVNIYKAQHRYELPEQLDANLKTLEQLRAELQANSLRLSSLQERKGNLEKQLVEAKLVVTPEGQAAGWQSLDDRKLQLEQLLTSYSEKHPDVIRLKREIQTLEAEAKKQQSTKGSTSTESPLLRNPVQQTLAKQIADLNLEINALRSSNESLKSQIASYSARVDNTPVRAIELSKVTRAYDIMLKKYQDLQGKALDSQLSENMEKKNEGEQFQVIDQANLPQQPVTPDRLRILIVGLVLAVTAGFGLAFLRENLDTSFKGVEDLRVLTDLPILASLPLIGTRGSVLEHRRSQRMLAVASLVIFAIGTVSIHLFTKFYY